jgi:hypothetical protein
MQQVQKGMEADTEYQAAPGVGAQIISGSASSTSSHSTHALARMDFRGVKMSACSYNTVL